MPEETRYEKLFAALVAGNYHSAKATKRYGGDWADRVKWLEARQSAVLTRIPKLGHAARLLRDGGQPEDAKTLLKHAHAAVNRAHVLTHGRGAGGLRDVSIAKAADLEDPSRWLDVLGVLEELGMKEATLTVNRSSYDPVSGLSEFGATLTHRPRPDIDTFKNWSFSADPRHWKYVLPEMFELSEEITSPLVPDRFINPPATKMEALTAPPKPFTLFEVARLKMIGLPLTKFRNVLDVNFVIDSEPNGTLTTLTPTYSLHESLTSTLLDFPRSEGGIDVDSCEPGTSKVTLVGDPDGKNPDGKITIKAAKRIRFSAEADFAIELNLLALPFLEAWITEFLIVGAAAHGVSAQRISPPPGRRDSIIPVAAE